MRNYIFIIIIIFTLSSCVTREKCNRLYPPTIETVYVSEIKEVVKDTTITLPADSSWLRALVECDSLGNAYIKQIIDLKTGKHTTVHSQITGNILYTNCEVDSMSVYVAWKEKYEVKTSTTTKTVVVETNILTGWQWFQIWLGRIIAALLIIILIVKFIKRKITI